MRMGSGISERSASIVFSSFILFGGFRAIPVQVELEENLYLPLPC